MDVKMLLARFIWLISFRGDSQLENYFLSWLYLINKKGKIIYGK